MIKYARVQVSGNGEIDEVEVCVTVALTESDAPDEPDDNPPSLYPTSPLPPDHTYKRYADRPPSWTSPASTGDAAITDYEIQVSEDGGTNWNDLHTTQNRATLFTRYGLNCCRYSRHYRVADMSSVSTGVYSDMVAAEFTLAPTSLTANSCERYADRPFLDGGSLITGY